MKSSIVSSLIVLAAGAITGPAALVAQERFNATVPFNFSVGGKALSAGDYSVERTHEHVLIIRNILDGECVIALVQSGQESRRPGPPVMRFNRYGSQYFLSAVLGSSQGWNLPRSKAEKELVAKAAAPKPDVLEAALRSK